MKRITGDRLRHLIISEVKHIMRNPNILKESPTTDNVDMVIKKIASLTDHNDHTGAIIELAKLTGNQKFINIANAIRVIHDNTTNGGIPYLIQQYRSGEFYDEMHAYILRRYGKDVADALHDAF